MHEIINVLGLN